MTEDELREIAEALRRISKWGYASVGAETVLTPRDFFEMGWNNLTVDRLEYTEEMKEEIWRQLQKKGIP